MIAEKPGIRIGAEGLFLNNETLDKIRAANLGKDTKYAIALYVLLGGMASEAGQGTVQLDVEYLRRFTRMSERHCVAVLEAMARAGAIMIDGAEVTVAYPGEEAKSRAYRVGVVTTK